MDIGVGISVIGRDDGVAMITVKDPPDRFGIAYHTFNALAESGIDVDLILQTSTGHGSGGIIFTVQKTDAERACEILNGLFADSPSTAAEADTDIVKLTVSGSGMQGKPGVAAKVFRCLWDAEVRIVNISTSEIKISMLIRTADAEIAAQALLENFDMKL